MATQTVEFPASTGRTLTAKLFALGSDTQTDSQSATEATNRKGVYAAAFTDVAAARYKLVVLDGSSVPAFVGYVTLTLTTATFEARSEPDSVTEILTAITGSTLFTGITSLAQWLGLIAGKQTGNSTARTEIRATGAGSGTYDETTDSLEANRDNIGTTGAALTVALSTQGKADVNAEVLDVINVDTFAEIGQEAPAATNTLRKMIGYLFKAWRNKSTQTSTTQSLYADDGTTVDQKATCSDDGTTFTRGEMGTGP